MNKGRKSIYPLSIENLIALMAYYFPDYEQGKASMVLDRYIDCGITLRDLEISFSQIQPYLNLLEREIETALTQVNISLYAVEIFIDPHFHIKNSGKRLRTIEKIQAAAEGHG